LNRQKNGHKYGKEIRIQEKNSEFIPFCVLKFRTLQTCPKLSKMKKGSFISPEKGHNRFKMAIFAVMGCLTASNARNPQLLSPFFISLLESMYQELSSASRAPRIHDAPKTYKHTHTRLCRGSYGFFFALRETARASGGFG